MLESIPVGTNKCPIHKQWVQKWRRADTDVPDFRYCAICLLADQKANPQDYNKPLPITKKITL